MNVKKTSLLAFCLAACCAGPALAQTAVFVDNGVNSTAYGPTAATPGPTLGLGPLTGIVTTTAAPGEGSTLIVTGTGVVATSTGPGGVPGGAFILGQTTSFIGVRGSGPAPVSGLQSTSAGTNTLIGTTASAGLTNTGNITTTTFNSTGNSSVGGALAVAGATTTNGVVNTGNITTDTFNSTGNASVGGSLAVTGASTTNGIANTGAISTTTLATTGNTAVGGNLSVAGTTSTNGIDNNGQVISNVADGQAPTDAVNVRQLNAINGNQAAINAAQANTNQVMQAQTAENRRIASTGTAIVAAAAAIPALEAGKDMGFGAAVGGYDGRAAVSVGLAARISQAMQIKMHIGTGSGGRVAAGVGGLWSW